jgi:histidyl-tRNA synthetase
MSKIVKPRIASGFPEYLPEDQIEFNRLKSIIEETYQKYGFSPIDTPDLELKEVLLAKGGGETDQQVYEFSRGRNDFCLRFDLTVPLARYAAEHQADLVFPFRRYHIGKVHRAERAQAGRFREFYQCDIDIIGTNSQVVDAEFPVIINEIFDKFNFGEFVVRVNNRKILNGFFAGIDLSDRKTEVMRLVDKVEKISNGDFRQALTQIGLDAAQISSLQSFIAIAGNNDDILDQLTALDVKNDEFQNGLNDLKVLVKSLRSFAMPEERFRIDLRIARGLDYYTGTVYETYLVDHPGLGSVCSGGRFDNLASHYTTTNLPGVGISIGLTRLFYKLKETGAITADRKSMSPVVVLPMDDSVLEYAVTVSARLRESGVSNILYSETNPFRKKMKYADQMGFAWAVIVGNDEIVSQTVSVKHMKSGEVSVVPFS